MSAGPLLHTVYAILAENRSLEELDRDLNPLPPADTSDGQLARIYALGGQVME